MNISIKRVYDPPAKTDGFRILVDRLWPRGLSKEKAHLDLWCKEIAPSRELRQWFNHQADRWEEFQERYLEELAEAPATVDAFLQTLREHKNVTLLYGAKDEEHNQAVALLRLLRRRSDLP